MQNNSGQPAEQQTNQLEAGIINNSTDAHTAVNRLLLALLEETRRDITAKAWADSQIALTCISETQTAFGLAELLALHEYASHAAIALLLQLTTPTLRLNKFLKRTLYPTH